MEMREWTDGVLGTVYDRTSTANTLSPYVVGDTLIRTELYREIRRAQEGPEFRAPGSWGAYVVSPDEILRPDLIAYRAYSVDGLRWVVCMAAGLDNLRDTIPSGTTLYLPTLAWIHDKLAQYGSIEVRS